MRNIKFTNFLKHLFEALIWMALTAAVVAILVAASMPLGFSSKVWLLVAGALLYVGSLRRFRRPLVGGTLNTVAVTIGALALFVYDDEDTHSAMQNIGIPLWTHACIIGAFAFYTLFALTINVATRRKATRPPDHAAQ